MFHFTFFQQFLNDFIFPTTSQPSCVAMTYGTSKAKLSFMGFIKFGREYRYNL